METKLIITTMHSQQHIKTNITRPNVWTWGYQPTQSQRDKTRFSPAFGSGVVNHGLQLTVFAISKSLWPWMKLWITDWHRVGPQITHDEIRLLTTCHLFTACRLRDISFPQWQQSVLEYHNKSGGRSVSIKASYYLIFRAILHSPTTHIYLRHFLRNRPTFPYLLLHHTCSCDRKLTAEYSKLLGMY